MDKLNFNRYAKNELLAAPPLERGDIIAWISAAIKAIGSLKIEKRGASLIFESVDYEYIETLADAIKSLYFCELEIEIGNVNTGLQKGKLYTLKVPVGHTAKVLTDTGVIKDAGGFEFNSGIPGDIIKNESAAVYYLKSLFVAVGAAGVPVKIIGEDEDISSSGSGYYLEFSFADEDFAVAVKKLLAAFNLQAKTVERGNRFVTYIKESEVISDFFALTSASETVLYMQDIMVERMLNNNVNRKSNCEAANMDKTAIASARQIIAINKLSESYGLGRLPAGVRELAQLRLENPTASLDFLAERLGVSKSCVNHRFRKLIAMAEEYDRGEE